jgi:hypothetical protein
VDRTVQGLLRRLRTWDFEATESRRIPFADADTEERLRRAVEAVGRVVEADEPDDHVRGRVRYGLAQASVRISFDPVDAHSTRVVINACGEDRWGVGARSAITRIFDAVEHLDEPGYRPNRFGPNLVNFGFQLTMFGVLLVAGLYAWSYVIH